MAVTAGGTPYVESTDLVATYPATSLTLANKIDTKVDYALPVNAQTGTTYTFVLADGLRLTTASNAASSTYTIPPQSSVVWLANSVIRLVNYGAGVVTVDGGVGVTVTNAAKTLAQFESAALVRTGSNAWTLVPFSGGVSYAKVSSPAATGNYTDGGGVQWNYYTFNSGGTLTFSAAGFAQVFLVSGGAGSASGPNGAGGRVIEGIFEVNATSYTVTVGAGGTSGGGFGGESSLGTLVRSFRSSQYEGGAGNTGANQFAGRDNDYTGSTINYGASGAFPPVANRGQGANGTSPVAGSSGQVVVRVKA